MQKKVAKNEETCYIVNVAGMGPKTLPANRSGKKKMIMSERKLRNYMSEKFGKRNYRIRNAGGIDAYGKIPNTNATGWYFLGWRDDVVALIKIGQL